MFYMFMLFTPRLAMSCYGWLVKRAMCTERSAIEFKYVKNEPEILDPPPRPCAPITLWVLGCSAICKCPCYILSAGTLSLPY